MPCVRNIVVLILILHACKGVEHKKLKEIAGIFDDKISKRIFYSSLLDTKDVPGAVVWTRNQCVEHTAQVTNQQLLK